jgi:DNA-binding winged helix-turn-helix (wHTH) protein
MDSAKPPRLCSLLLQRLDQHPIRAISAADAEPFGEAVSEYRRLQLLRFRRALDELDLISVTVDEHGDAAIESGAHDGSRLLDVDFRAVGLQIRRSSGLVGPPLEKLNDKVIHLGQLPDDPHRRVFYLVRTLTDANAIELTLSLKGRAGLASPVILTPTPRDFGLDITRRIALEGVILAAASNLLDEQANTPLALRLTAVGLPTELPPDAIEIDQHGSKARFYRKPLKLEPRDFRVLVELAREAGSDGGFVSVQDLLAAIAEGKAHDALPQGEQVTASVSRLRLALGAAAGLDRLLAQGLIVNDRKGGYRLAIEPGKISLT